eukprot:scaffold191902_cov22-Tisochrysis_lutea.AAC.1
MRQGKKPSLSTSRPSHNYYTTYSQPLLAVHQNLHPAHPTSDARPVTRGRTSSLKPPFNQNLLHPAYLTLDARPITLGRTSL